MPDKPFKTHDELIALLNSRGLEIVSDTDQDYTKQVLSQIGYYNLINGYNKMFLDESVTNGDYYKNGTTIKEIHALYQFDKKLRSIFMKYILTIETHIKSLIAYYFSEAHGHKNYLVYNNFNTNIKDAHKHITALIAGIQSQISSRSTDPSIQHYLKEYGYIPLWVLNNILTLGTISKFYSLMKVPERQSISKQFGILDKDLETCLRYLSNVRNFCAHDNRLYCFRNRSPIMDTIYHQTLDIKRDKSNEYICGKRDLFAAVIALKLLLSKNDMKRMSKEIYSNLGILYRKLSVLSKDDILTAMGFPTNWKYIEKL